MTITDVEEADTVKPVVTLKGAATITLTQGATYTEQGASATDARDGTVAVKTTGTVNTAKVGTYTITYTATDKAGNKASKTRTVIVILHRYSPIIKEALGDIKIREFIESGSKTYFVVGNKPRKEKIYVTDGTVSGTHLVVDSKPKSGFHHSEIGDLMDVNGTLFYIWDNFPTKYPSQNIYEIHKITQNGVNTIVKRHPDFRNNLRPLLRGVDNGKLVIAIYKWAETWTTEYLIDPQTDKITVR